MRVIIAGSRLLADPNLVDRAMQEFCEKMAARGHFEVPSMILSGGAKGIDQLGERWAKAHLIPIQTFPADWQKHGKAAGMIRNREMAKFAHACVVIWDGSSRGSASMISEAKKADLELLVVTVRKPTIEWVRAGASSKSEVKLIGQLPVELGEAEE